MCVCVCVYIYIYIYIYTYMYHGSSCGQSTRMRRAQFNLDQILSLFTEEHACKRQHVTNMYEFVCVCVCKSMRVCVYMYISCDIWLGSWRFSEAGLFSVSACLDGCYYGWCYSFLLPLCVCVCVCVCVCTVFFVCAA